MKKRLIIFFCACVSMCSAQFMDTIQQAFRGKKSLDLGFDSRNSFIDNKRVGVQCLKMGVDFGKKFTIGAGYAWLNANTPVLHSYSFHDAELKKDTSVNRRLKLQYGCFYINYIYYKSRRWEFSVPLQVGVGKLSYSYPYRGMTKKENVGYCFLYEPEVNVKFTLLRWLGLEGDVGYRILVQKNHMIKNTFNSPLFALGVFIKWNELALMAFPKSEWAQNKFGPSEW